MAVSKQEVIVEFNADTGNIDKAVSVLGTGMQEVADAATDAANATEDIGESAKKSGGLLKKAGKSGADAFKLLGTAIAATGLIGLVSKVLEPIIAAFLENKTVAGALSAAMAGLGAVIDTVVTVGEKLVGVLVDAFNNPQEAIINLKDAIVNNITTRIEGMLELFPRLGKAISAAFRGDFSEAGKIAADAVGQVALGVENVTDKVAEATEVFVEYVAETGKAAVEATKLDMALGSLADRERELAVETARQSANIEELKRQRDDERLSIEERLRLSQEAAAIDQRIADENVSIQEEKARLLRQEIKLQGETEERLQALADAEIAAADARAASAGVQTELMTNIYSLNQEAIDIEQEVAALRREFVAENLEGIEAERQALEDQLTDRVTSIERLKITEEEKTALILEATASRDEQLEALEREHQAELDEIAKQAAEEEAARQKELADQAAAQRAQELADEEAIRAAKYQLAQDTLGAISALNEAFAKEGEAQSRRNFKIQKALSLAQTTIGAVEGVQNAFTTGQKSPITALFPGYPFVQAGIAAAFGAAQIATVGKSKYQGGSTKPSVPSGGGGGGGGVASAASGGTQAPQLDLGFLGAGAGQEAPVQAYVLAENVSTAQQANQKIQDQATL